MKNIPHLLLVTVMILCGHVVVFAQPSPALNDSLVKVYHKKKLQFESWDKKGLRYSRGVVTDRTKEFLRIPDYYDDWREFTMAKEAPDVDFAPVRNIHPEFQLDGIGEWTHWGEVSRGPNGCFYMGVGNHRKGGTENVLLLIEYDPIKKEQRIAVDVGGFLGWKPGEYTDTMLHGNMNFLPDGRLVAATWFGHKGPKNMPEEAVNSSWYGSWVFTYNIHTWVAESHGIPMLNGTWSMHSTDPRTGILMAVGIGYAEGYPDERWTNRDTGYHYRGQHYFMAYDVDDRKVHYAGLPPGNIDLSERASLIDPRTGLFYSSDSHNGSNIVCYDQRTNRWRDLKCKIPLNPATGKNDILRAYTYRPTPEGIFYCMDMIGTFFSFHPEEERTELLGVSWHKEGIYTASVAMSPGCRYIYYLPDAHGHHPELGQPVVQYDTDTKKKKVLAFLSPFYHEKYGYVTKGSYGIELNEDGSQLFALMNGTFNPKYGKGRYSHPSIFIVNIPESERRE
ncbi:hypothetical protein ACFL47_03415 [Candidatus Latescibacterota bacterium]